MADCAIAFDVGGTSIKTALVDGSGRLIPETAKSYPSMAKQSKDTILSHLLDLIRQQARVQSDGSVSGIAMAFPGPFDYARGISLMKGLDKYDALYGVNLERELRRMIEQDPALLSRFADGWRIVFENDVRAFALGQLRAGRASAYDRCLCVTIGTGFGSAFLERGRIVTSGEGVPADGWIYNQPFRDGIVDDYISRRGILRVARGLGFDPERHDVKDLAVLARQGERAAAEVFRRFGALLAAALNPYIASFQPEALIIGGQVAKSGDLFLETFMSDVTRNVEIWPVEDTSASAFVGVASLLFS